MKSMKPRHKPQLQLLAGLWHLLEQTMGFGNPTDGGFKTAREALTAVGELNKDLMGRHELEFAVGAEGCQHA